jgi:Cellulose biosynthesis protein BcsS
MRRWRRVRAATAVAAALVVCCVGVPAGPARAGDDDAHLILFSGGDLWFDGAFAHGGLLWSPGGLDRDGFTFKALISGGLYRYKAGDLGGERVMGTELAGQALPGWRIKRGNFETKMFIGAEIQNNRLSPDDPGNRLRGINFGLRVALEFWSERTSTTMLAADASLSSIATNYSARAAYGWRVLDRFYAGPETQVYGGDGYRQLRFGMHLTGFKIGNNEWSAAAGWTIDTDNRSSPYLRISVMKRQ